MASLGGQDDPKSAPGGAPDASQKAFGAQGPLRPRKKSIWMESWLPKLFILGRKSTPRAAQEAPERRPRGPSALRASQTETERQTEKTKDKYNDLYMLSVLSLSGLGSHGALFSTNWRLKGDQNKMVYWM